jgi:hypothetical protein
MSLNGEIFTKITETLKWVEDQSDTTGTGTLSLFVLCVNGVNAEYGISANFDSCSKGI